MARLAPTPEAEQKVVGSVPLGRMGTRTDVADLVMFLASPRAAYITGAIITVHRGWSAKGARGRGAAGLALDTNT